MLWKLDNVGMPGTPHPRLRNLSLEIREGVTAVIGWSGAGKTSLLNLLVKMEKPRQGSIETPASFFWVPQNGGLWPHLTAWEHLEIVNPAPEKIARLLAAFDLAEKGPSRPDELSEGEQSRLSVARALMTNAAALVMDEPLVHVDPARSGNYWRVIREHLAETGASLVFSTHVPETVLGEANHVICLKEGRLLYEGPVDKLYWNPPTPELAGCLGPANWFTPGEARQWLQREEAEPRCLRPEQLSIREDASGPFIVESSCFQGAVAGVELRHSETGATRLFFHRPSSNRLQKGARVIMSALLLMLMMFLCAGCNHSAEPKIAMSEFHSWVLPSEGTLLPAARSVAIGKNDEVTALDTAGRVLVFDSGGTLLRRWSMPDTSVGKPEGVCVLNDGRVVVCDTHYYRIVFFDSQGKVVNMFGTKGDGPGQFIYPVGITKDDQENLYVCEYGGNDRIQKFTRDGKFLASFGSFGTGAGQLQRPSGLAWLDHKLYIADAINNRVLIYTDDGKYMGVLDNAAHPLALQLPYGVVAAPDHTLYIVEYGAGRITRADANGNLLGRLGSEGNGDWQFATPWGIAIDSKMRIRVADTKNRRIADLRP